jgi:hypothetical protein
MSPLSTCIPVVATYVLDATMVYAIVEHYNGQMPSVMVWTDIGYHMRSCLLCFEGNLNSNCYTREVLECKVLPLLQATPYSFLAGHCLATYGRNCANLL